jgi:hypothetical protein
MTDVSKLITDLKETLRIDKHALDSAIEKQASTYFRVAEQSALAQSRRDQAKADMDSEFAEACNAARAKAAKTDAKITEAMVKEQAEHNRSYKEAVDAYLDTRKDADLLQALERSFEQRGKMLRELAQLYIAGYYQMSGARAADSANKTATADGVRAQMQARRAERRV